MIRQNGYNNPEFGEIASNIASLFAPPSAQDLAGYATAKAKTQEAERLSAVFDYANDPNFSQEMADRLATASGVYLPTQSWSAQNQNDATQRYGYDTTAATSRANNAADNDRAFATSIYGTTIGQGEIMPEVPSSVAGMYAVEPRGVVAGQPKPLSLTEAQAQTYSGMSPELQEAITFGSTPVDTVMQGDQPVNVTRPNAIGQTPVVEPGDTPTSIKEYEYAVAQGFPGDYNAWLIEKARAGATKVQVGSDERKTATANAQSTGTDVIVNATRRALTADEDRTLTGVLGYGASFLPGSENAEAYRQVDVLKSNATIEALQAMRAASPTGGALGSVTEKENAMLAAKLGALDPASPNFERDLKDYSLTLMRTVHGYEAGTLMFEAEFGELAPDQKSRVPAAAAGQVPTPAPAAPGGDVLQEARDAIARGADPAAVRARLEEMGVDPGGL